MPPTRYLLNPPPPKGQNRMTYYQPDCLFQCILVTNSNHPFVVFPKGNQKRMGLCVALYLKLSRPPDLAPRYPHVRQGSPVFGFGPRARAGHQEAVGCWMGIWGVTQSCSLTSRNGWRLAGRSVGRSVGGHMLAWASLRRVLCESKTSKASTPRCYWADFFGIIWVCHFFGTPQS